MKIAHLSDIHFYETKWSFSTFFSKRLLGTLNHACNPNRKSLDFDVFELPSLFKSMGIEWIFISGDMTTTSNQPEYTKSKRLIEFFEQQGLKVLAIPGNHDHYTSKAHRNRCFYNFIESPSSLKEERYSLQKLNDEYSCLLLDTTLATPPWSSQGYFFKDLELRLKALLADFDPKKKLIVMNHFPVLPNDRPKRHQMLRKEYLRRLLEAYPQIKVYLHGHTHKSEFSLSQHPIHINCGSLTLTENGSFHVMDLTSDFLEVKAYHYESKKWEVRAKKTFPMKAQIKEFA